MVKMVHDPSLIELKENEKYVQFPKHHLKFYFKCELYHDEKSSQLDYVLCSQRKNNNFYLPLSFLLPFSKLLTGPSSQMEQSISGLELQAFFDSHRNSK